MVIEIDAGCLNGLTSEQNKVIDTIEELILSDPNHKKSTEILGVSYKKYIKEGMGIRLTYSIDSGD